MGKMFSFGKVLVAAAGTPVRATSTQTTPSTKVSAHTIFFQALSGNTGRVFVGGPTMNKTTLAGVYGMIPAPSASTATGTLPYFEATIVPAPNGLNLADFWLDAEQSTDGVLIAGSEA